MWSGGGTAGVWLGLGVVIAILTAGRLIMAAIDDLNTAVQRLNASVDKVVAVLAAGPSDGPALVAATAAVNAAADKLDAATAGTPPTPKVVESPGRLIDQMTAEEAIRFAERREVPERLAAGFARLASASLELASPPVPPSEPADRY